MSFKLVLTTNYNNLLIANSGQQISDNEIYDYYIAVNYINAALLLMNVSSDEE